jgi:hypothetical protein
MLLEVEPHPPKYKRKGGSRGREEADNSGFSRTYTSTLT